MNRLGAAVVAAYPFVGLVACPEFPRLAGPPALRESV
jgi:hypothetical protein